MMKPRRFLLSIFALVLFGGVGKLSSVRAAPTPTPQQSGSFDQVVKHVEPLSCDIDLIRFGVREAMRVPLTAATANAYLRIKIIRYAATGGEKPDEDRTNYRLAYQDLILIYHFSDEELRDDLIKVIDEVRAGRRPKDVLECAVIDPTQLLIFEPFIYKKGAHIYRNRKIISVVRNVLTPIGIPAPLAKSNAAPKTSEHEPVTSGWLGHATSAIAPDGKSPEPPAGDDGIAFLEREPTASSSAEPERKVVAPYPWLAEMDFANFTAGEQALAIDKITCERAGNFIVGTVGEIVEPKSSPESDPPAPQDANKVSIRRQFMLASNHYFGVSGDVESRDAVELSVNPTEYWCLPKMEFCYQPVSFGDFGIRAHADEVSAFDSKHVVSLRHGMLMALERVFLDNCADEISATSSERSHVSK